MPRYTKEINLRHKHLSSPHRGSLTSLNIPSLGTLLHRSPELISQLLAPLWALQPFTADFLFSSTQGVRQRRLCSNGLLLHGRTPPSGTTAVCNDAPCSALLSGGAAQPDWQTYWDRIFAGLWGDSCSADSNSVFLSIPQDLCLYKVLHTYCFSLGAGFLYTILHYFPVLPLLKQFRFHIKSGEKSLLSNVTSVIWHTVRPSSRKCELLYSVHTTCSCFPKNTVVLWIWVEYLPLLSQQYKNQLVETCLKWLIHHSERQVCL